MHLDALGPNMKYIRSLACFDHSKDDLSGIIILDVSVNNVKWCFPLPSPPLFCVCFCVCGRQKPEDPQIEPMAEDAITRVV